MSSVLEVHATRIQAYLARSARLRHVRGASAMLSRAFQEVADKISDNQIEGAGPLIGAPAIDGKLFAFVPVGDEVQPTAERILASLREHLPGADLEASWARGERWSDLPIDAHRDRLEAPPSLVDLPVAARCALCTIDPAVVQRRIVDEHLGLCRDCDKRESAEPLVPPSGPPAAGDFNELALAGRTDGGRKNNHLATVYIDGNRLGAVFRAAAEADVDRPKLAAGIVDATKESWDAATAAVQQRAEQLSGVPPAIRPLALHIMGGDDILASMPACFGTLFAYQYLSTFDQRSKEITEALGWNDAPALTASGGVVIAHVKHPFARASEAATELCTRAKRAFLGRESSLAWVDLTREQADDGPAPWTLASLEDSWTALGNLAALPSARLARLAALLEADGVAAVRADALRMEDHELLEPFLADTSRADLATALELVRWWS